jgi:hypothetical protein
MNDAANNINIAPEQAGEGVSSAPGVFDRVSQVVPEVQAGALPVSPEVQNIAPVETQTVVAVASANNPVNQVITENTEAIRELTELERYREEAKKMTVSGRKHLAKKIIKKMFRGSKEASRVSQNVAFAREINNAA